MLVTLILKHGKKRVRNVLCGANDFITIFARMLATMTNRLSSYLLSRYTKRDGIMEIALTSITVAIRFKPAPFHQWTPYSKVYEGVLQAHFDSFLSFGKHFPGNLSYCLYRLVIRELSHLVSSSLALFFREGGLPIGFFIDALCLCLIQSFASLRGAFHNYIRLFYYIGF
ncbi:unnamed protein product (mitochondrion) [Musa acuminata var. zebrina]